jgi:AcrR family transcriptional regulator
MAVSPRRCTDLSAATNRVDERMKRNISLERRAEIGQEKRERTRKVILSAAYSLVCRKDGHLTRIEEICPLARISLGTFYNYFSSINELLDALAFEISNDINVRIRALLLLMPPGAFRVSAGARLYLHQVRIDQAWGRAMVNLTGSGPQFGFISLQHVAKVIAEGIELGEFQIPNVEIGCDLVMGTVLSAMMTMIRAPFPDEYPEMVARQILIGLGVRPHLIADCIGSDLPSLQDVADARITPSPVAAIPELTHVK